MAAEKPTGFHCFLQTTFIGSHFCNHCNNLLWGVKHQGMQCIFCRIIYHEKCLEQLGDTQSCRKCYEVRIFLDVTRTGKNNNQTTPHQHFCFRILRSKRLLGLARQPLRARKHCSSALQSPIALEIIAPACFFLLRRHIRVFCKILSEVVCFELCIASSCGLCDFACTLWCLCETNVYLLALET